MLDTIIPGSPLRYRSFGLVLGERSHRSTALPPPAKHRVEVTLPTIVDNVPLAAASPST